MAYWRSFSVSIFMICLFEFVFWFYCTISTAGAAEEMYMVNGIETFKHYITHREDTNRETVQEEIINLIDESCETNIESISHRNEEALKIGIDATIEHPVGRLGLWVALTLSLLVCKWIFPHFAAKASKAGEVLAHPVELYHMVKFKITYKVPEFPKNLSEADLYCSQKLVKVSRSFAAVIAELPEELRRPIANFYLVLRGLDTVEDDMSVPLEKKIPELRSFYTHLNEKGWHLVGYGDNKDEIDLLERFHYVVDVFLGLRPEYQKVIADITRRMGDGMAKYASEKKVVSMEDYNEYCHYVAGLVGIGLSQMFAASGLESAKFRNVDELANSMGLFLQKTNISRDYLEDVTAVNPRIFYPKDIWGKYAKNIEDLKEPQNKEAALKCLNEMVTDAMAHISDCLDYMLLLKHPNIFKFCGIPQAMAIATLARIYNNYDVFKKEVKIRKGEAVQIMMYGSDYENLIAFFGHYIKELESKIPANDPNAGKMRKYISVAKERIAMGRRRHQ